MTTAPVNKIIPFSFVDGNGNRTAVFLQGCNQNCLYCHNPETISLCLNCGDCAACCPAGALSIIEGKVCYNIAKCRNCDTCLKVCTHGSSPKTRELSAFEVMEIIRPNLPFISGITVSGGECTQYARFLTELFSLVKPAGKTTFIDTNGQIPLWDSGELLAVTDKFMIDLKSADPEEHKFLTGLSNENVMRNIKETLKLGKVYEIRTVVVPELLDNFRTVEAGSRLIAPYRGVRYKLIKFRPFGVREKYRGMNAPSDELMEKLRNTALENGVVDVIIT